MIYTHDTYGLGNIRRMLAIAQHMGREYPLAQVLVVTGSPMQHSFRVSPGVDFIKLPCLSRDRAGRYQSRGLDIPLSELVAIRRELIAAAYRHFEPDLLLVDKKPMGVKNELAGVFQEMDAQVKRPAVALVLRDILDSPDRTTEIWLRHGYFEMIREYYDLVLVAGQPELFNVGKEYGFPDHALKKLRYCGYIDGRQYQTTQTQTQPQPPAPQKDCRPGLPHILVTVGGGEDGGRIIESLVRAMRTSTFTERPEFTATVILGPEMPAGQRLVLRKIGDGVSGLLLEDFSDDMKTQIGVADLVLGMCGYNTVCEVLASGKPLLAIPRVEPVAEQLIRARRFSERGLLHFLHPSVLDPITLIEKIKECLSPPSFLTSSKVTLDFNGLDRIGYWSMHAMEARQQSAAGYRKRREYVYA